MSSHKLVMEYETPIAANRNVLAYEKLGCILEFSSKCDFYEYTYLYTKHSLKIPLHCDILGTCG